MKTTLVIASHNRASFLEEALRKLPLSAMRQHDVELILVDSGSSDETFEVMRRFALSIDVAAKVLQSKEKVLSIAHNGAAAYAGGDLLVFTDDDCYLDEDYFDNLLSAFNPTRHHYGAGQILTYDPADDPRVACTNWPQGMRREIAPGSFLPTGTVQGANMFVLRDVFLKLGGFNEELGPGSRFRSGADIELAARASASGFTGILLADVCVRHHHRRRNASAEADDVVRRYDYGRGVYYAGLIAQGDQRAWAAWSQQSATASSSPQVLERLQREFRGAADFLDRSDSQPVAATASTPTAAGEGPMRAPAPPGSRTQAYWENRYRAGGDSGAGSYDALAQYKSTWLNRFVTANRISNVIEFGCGDGNQLSLSAYPQYHGVDISRAAVERCRSSFRDDATKAFSVLGHEPAGRYELGLSLDVIYHLLEDETYFDHLERLFGASSRFVVIYGNDFAGQYPASHVRLRDFTKDVAERYPEWELIETVRNPYYSREGTDPAKTWANFFVYGRRLQAAGGGLDLDLPAPVEDDGSADPMDRLVDEYLTRRAGNASRIVCSDVRWAAVERKAKVCGALRVSADDQLLPSGPRAGRGTSSRPLDASTLCVVDSLEDWAVVQGHLAKGMGDALIAAPHERTAVIEQLEESVSRWFLREVLPVYPTGLSDLGSTLRFYRPVAVPKVIVSLTTIRSRLGELERVIRSILEQSLSPDLIVLNLSAEPFMLDEGVPVEALLPSIVRLYEQGLLHVQYGPNTGPYRKLLPTLSQVRNNNCVIVTADDDTIYPSDWLKGLVATHLRTGAVVAWRCWPMQVAGGRFAPYMSWIGAERSAGIREDAQSLFLLPTGKDGVLYAPRHFHPAIFDEALIEVAPAADDLAIKFATLLAGAPVVALDHRAVDRSVTDPRLGFKAVSSAGPTLWQSNETKNDEHVARLHAYFAERWGFDLDAYAELDYHQGLRSAGA